MQDSTIVVRVTADPPLTPNGPVDRYEAVAKWRNLTLGRNSSTSQDVLVTVRCPEQTDPADVPVVVRFSLRSVNKDNSGSDLVGPFSGDVEQTKLCDRQGRTKSRFVAPPRQQV